MRSIANEMKEEDLTPHNVRSASTFLFLRMRARTVRAQYKRYWECIHAIQPHQFVFDTPERGDGEENDKERIFDYISKHVIRIEDLRKQINLNGDVKARLMCANRQGGPRHRMWEARNEAVLNELIWRDKNQEDPTARAVLWIEDISA